MLIATPLKSIEAWNEYLEKLPATKELVIFKVSPRCPVSFFIEKEFDRWLPDVPDENLSIIKVDVINARPLSQHIAQSYNVKHESPQLIWLDTNRQVKWHASHHGIKSEELNKRLP